MLKSHLNTEQISERLYRSRNGHPASYGQIIVSVSLNPGKAASQYYAFLGISDSKCYRMVSLYNERGAAFCEALQWAGRREPCCMMSFKEEEERLQSQAAIALQGKVLVAGQLRSVVAQKMSHAVWDDSLWDLLHRHGWSKKAPRPQHPKADEQVKEQRKAFKKSTRTPLLKRHRSNAPKSFLLC